MKLSIPGAFLLLGIISIWSIVNASENFSTEYYAWSAGAFLQMPSTAQSAALGDAVTAWIPEHIGSQRNPALLDDISSFCVRANYAIMSLGRKYLFAEAGTPIGSYFVANASIIDMSVSGFTGRDDFGDITENFSDHENALTLSIAGRALYNLSFGLTTRYLHQSLADGRANGIGFDLGATWNPLQELAVGVSGCNLFSKMWWNTGHSDPVLASARLGIAGILLDSALISEIDFVKTLNQPIDATMGAQYSITNSIALRAGIASSIDIETQSYRPFDYSCGIGISYLSTGMDYSLSVPSSSLGLIHRITIHFHLSTFQ